MAGVSLQEGVSSGWSPLAFVLGIGPPLVLAGIVYWDATKRDIDRRYTWTGGTLVAVLAPIFGAYIVALLYFLVNRDHSRRVPTTGYALGGLGVVQGVVAIGYAFAARSILVAVVGIVLPAILLVAWYVSE